MDTVLLSPCYFGPISVYVALTQAKHVIFENEENYQKQTYRNRMYIYGANGKQALTIPVKHSGKNNGRQKYRDVRIENGFPWQQQHWKSLQTAYRSSPFFEFYEDDLAPLYHRTYDHLLEFNYSSFEMISQCLQHQWHFSKTRAYREAPSEGTDLRRLAEAKGTYHDVKLTPYPQVFEKKAGFISDLSILDLLFNEGPNALSYLEQQAKLRL